MSAATLQTAFGEVSISRDGYWGGIELRAGETRLILTVDDVRDPSGEPSSFRLRRHFSYDKENAAELLAVVGLAAAVCYWIDESMADAIAKAEERRRIEEEERERLREERAALVESRRQQLMTEFLGEEIKVRERGYKTMRRAIVEVREAMGYQLGEDGLRRRGPTGEYELRLNYIGDIRTQHVGSMIRVDVKVGSGWQTVWDDGADDVYGQLAASANPTKKKYDGGLS